MEWLQVFSFFNFLKRKKLWKILKIVLPCPSPYHDHMEYGYPLYKPLYTYQQVVSSYLNYYLYNFIIFFDWMNWLIVVFFLPNFKRKNVKNRNYALIDLLLLKPIHIPTSYIITLFLVHCPDSGKFFEWNAGSCEDLQCGKIWLAVTHR